MAYKILFFLFSKEVENLKEIGEKLKATREEMGISLEEAAEDLKLRTNQVEDIENGNMESFKDIYCLKGFIHDYAKYLGLDCDKIIDEFNEYLFDYTSKISLEDIIEAKKKINNVVEEPEKKVFSPYTVEKKRKLIIPLWLMITILASVILIIITIIYFIKR